MIENRISDRAKILLIDEDTSISYLIRRAMEKENYKIYIAGSGKQGMEMSTGVCPDLILMDNKFSDMEGITLIQWFREWTDCPIIILSERSSYLDKVEALYAGADDYMVKPFHEKELAARIFSALRRRISAGAHTYYEAGNLKVDFTKRQVLLGGTEVHFSPVEYRIIESLALNSGTVVTYHAFGKNMGTICRAKQQDPSCQYDEYPEKNRKFSFRTGVYYNDPAGRIPDVGESG